MEPSSSRHPDLASPRSPAFILIMTLLTCGLYLIYWYYEIYQDLIELTKQTPTGNDYFLDLFLVFMTCGLWGVYVDYIISEKLNGVQERAGLPVNDTTTLIIILDVMAFAVGLTNIITSMIHQDQLNKIWAHLIKNTSSGFTRSDNKTDPFGFREENPGNIKDVSHSPLERPRDDPNPYD